MDDRKIETPDESWKTYLEKWMPPDSRLPLGSRNWDFFDRNTGYAVSAKTLDTTATDYVSDPRKLYIALTDYIDGIVAPERASRWKMIYIDPADIKIRQIQIAIPDRTSPAQWTQINRAVLFGKSKGVSVVVTRIG